MQFIPLRNSRGRVETTQSHSLAHENNGRIILNTGSIWCVSSTSKTSRCPRTLKKQETMGLVFAEMQQMFMEIHFEDDGTKCVIVAEQFRFTAHQAKRFLAVDKIRRKSQICFWPEWFMQICTLSARITATFSIWAVVFLLADTFSLKCTSSSVSFPQGHRSQVSAYRQSLKTPTIPCWTPLKMLDSPQNDRHVHSLAKC